MIEILFCFMTFPLFVMASDLKYFDSKIDFWGDRESTVKTDSTSSGEFPWKTYLDPKNKEFFKEGDYTPPEPFMEIARNPTDENIQSWFEFTQKKNELAKRLEARMQEYLAKNETSNPESQMKAPLTAASKPKTLSVKVDPARFKIRMYFESTCPHCRKMFVVLKQLQDNGFKVEALEVDSGPVPDIEKMVPIGKADPQELKKHGIKGVPFLLIADLKREALLPAIEGYHDFEEVMGLIKVSSQN
jgi:thiol-disulfide isomerase/thioredoxin